MALTASQHFEGPRLDDLKVTTADYGAPLNYGYGLTRFDGTQCIFAEPLKEVRRRRKTKGGKFNDYSYFGTFAIAVCDHQVAAITRIWFDRNLVYDATGAGPVTPFAGLGSLASYMRFYLGTETQDPDARMLATVEAAHGAGACPAYRGVAYVMFEDLPLEKIGNRLPQVSIEVAGVAAATYPYETFATVGLVGAYLGPLVGFSYSPDGTRAIWGVGGHYEIWDVAARAQMIAGTLAASLDPTQDSFGISSTGRIYAMANTGVTLASIAADGVGAASTVHALTYTGLSCRVLRHGGGGEVVCILPQTTFPSTYGVQIWDIGLGAMTEVATGWLPSAYCVDEYGDIWAAGHDYISFPTTSTATLYLLRVVDTGARPGSIGYAAIPGLPTTSAFSHVAIMHAGGAFVVAWNYTDLYRIEDTGLTVATHRALGVSNTNIKRQLAEAKAGAAAVWIDNGGTTQAMEISTAALTTLRTVSYSSWFTTTAVRVVYDPISNALIGANTAFPDQLTWFYLDRFSGGGVLLSDIVGDISARSGLIGGDWAASDLNQPVAGYSWIQGSGQAILEPLLEAYDSEVRPHGFALQFLKRGVPAAGSIGVGELVGRYRVIEPSDGDLPAAVAMTFADPAIDGQPNTALARRTGAAVDAKAARSLDMTTLRVGATTARTMAEGYLRRLWTEGEEVHTALTRAHTALEPGDAYSISLDDIDRVLKCRRLEFGGDGVLTCEWTRYLPGLHVTTALSGAAADGVTPAVLAAVGYTKGLVLDIPLARDVDDGLIVYLAATPYASSPPWPGAGFTRGLDGITFADAIGDVPSTARAVIGYTISGSGGVLADASSAVWDRGSSLSVTLHDGALTSTTEAAVSNGANLALIGGEIVGFTTAALTAPETYRLSGLLRGRRGTEANTAGHVAGERFVLLCATAAAGLPTAALGASELGGLDYYQATTVGGVGGFVQAMTYSGASLKPYSPAHLKVAASGADKLATWTRRTRIGGAWRDLADAALGEGSEAYQVDILNGGGSVIRTITGLSTPTATYTAAQIAADGGLGVTLKAYQISATVGRGFAASAAI